MGGHGETDANPTAAERCRRCWWMRRHDLFWAHNVLDSNIVPAVAVCYGEQVHAVVRSSLDVLVRNIAVDTGPDIPHGSLTRALHGGHLARIHNNVRNMSLTNPLPFCLYAFLQDCRRRVGAVRHLEML